MEQLELQLSTSDLAAAELPCRLLGAPEALQALTQTLAHTLPRILVTPRQAVGRCGGRRRRPATAAARPPARLPRRAGLAGKRG